MSLRKRSDTLFQSETRCWVDQLKRGLGLLNTTTTLPASRSLQFESMEPRRMMDGLPLISEFSADNKKVIDDEDGNSSDWIEIFNPTDQPIDLQGWYLTDDVDDLTKWQFPTVSIEAGAYLVVFASDKDRAIEGEELHTNFKLTADGEYLALVQDDGVSIASQFADAFPEQFEDISYGQSEVQQNFPLVSSEALAQVIVPNAADDAVIGSSWTGSDPQFDDSTATGWSTVTLGTGFENSTEPDPIDGSIAQFISEAAPGSQAFNGPLGMDFVVHRPITITSLGAFDDGANGIFSTITVSLWSRDDSGTPALFADDTGGSILAIQQFTTSSPGVLVGGNRFKTLAAPLILQPGAYTIVADGYSANERNGNSAGDGNFGQLADTTAFDYVGSSRFGVGSGTFFPDNIEAGPEARYGAGTFVFLDPENPIIDLQDPHVSVAYQTTTGFGNTTTDTNLGMDFDVNEPILITELGVFDSGQDGISGTLGVSLWQRTGNSGTLLVSQNFLGTKGTIAAGTGSRFIPLDEPMLLQPGSYTIVASGFFGEDSFSQAGEIDSTNGVTNTGGGAIDFVGTSRTSFGVNRFAEQAYHRFPERVDTGPVNRFAAGTFKFKTAFSELLQSDISQQMSDQNSSVYLRTAFDVGDPTLFEAMQLSINYDDGFVAYLNGVEIARRNAPLELQFNSTATTVRSETEVLTTETIDLTNFIHLLQPNSSNILAFQGLNISTSDDDFVIAATLEASRSIGFEEVYFTDPTPGAGNTEDTLGFVEDPQFSVQRGFITEDDLNDAGLLTVEISSATPNVQIFFTTDGTEPTATSGSFYFGPITISTTTTLRAIAVRDRFISSNIGTQSYIFLDDVLKQSGVPTGFSTHWNGEIADYDFSQNPDDLPLIAGNPNATEQEYNQAIIDSLLGLPTLSIVADPEDLFGLAEGLYTNPYPRGRETERAVSVEYILPDGSTGFQIGAGLRMMGWTSRIPAVSPKHSLRLVFRDDFGPSRLEYPLFDGIDVTSFDTIALRSNSRDTWISDYPFGNTGVPQGSMRSVATYVRDQWAKTVQADLGRPAAAANFVHLYLNGIYWGVYNPTERPDAAYAEEHFGGDEDDYDVVSFCNPTERSVHGDLAMWNELASWLTTGDLSDATYQRVQGNNPDGTRNPDYPVLIDVENFIDYMIAGQFDAPDDWPCNYYAIRDRGVDSTGFKFVNWDNDLGLPLGDVNASRIDIGFGIVTTNSPWQFEAGLRTNEEYMVQFSDTVQKHLFNDGQLTPEVNIQRWQDVTSQVEPGLIAESARWGDYRRDVQAAGPAELYTIENWNTFNQHMINVYFPQRSDVYVNQLRSKGLFPTVEAPSFNQHGGDILSGFQLEISATAGQIWFTVDGSDPRLSGGSVDPNATLYTGQIDLQSSTKVRTRALLGNQWSALNEATFQTSTPIRVSELMYNPDGNDSAEFIEITNISDFSVGLIGIHFVLDDSGDGFEYEFLETDTNLTLAAGEQMVIVRNRAVFQSLYPNVPESRIADREYSGGLRNSGETITLLDSADAVIQQFTYDDAWYPPTDGDGPSMVIVDINGELDAWSRADGWQVSVENGGSPARSETDDPFPAATQIYGLAQLLQIKHNFGQSSEAIPHLDFNNDGFIDSTDLAMLLSRYGSSFTPNSGSETLTVNSSSLAEENNFQTFHAQAAASLQVTFSVEESSNQIAKIPPIEINLAENLVQPTAIAPVAVKPVAVKPVAVKPVAVKPVAVKPVAVKPVAVKPVAVKPVVQTELDAALIDHVISDLNIEASSRIDRNVTRSSKRELNDDRLVGHLLIEDELERISKSIFT